MARHVIWIELRVSGPSSSWSTNAVHEDEASKMVCESTYTSQLYEDLELWPSCLFIKLLLYNLNCCSSIVGWNLILHNSYLCSMELPNVFCDVSVLLIQILFPWLAAEASPTGTFTLSETETISTGRRKETQKFKAQGFVSHCLPQLSCQICSCSPERQEEVVEVRICLSQKRSIMVIER